jgi:hypothetical protein
MNTKSNENNYKRCLDLSGLESLTDFMVYKISEMICQTPSNKTSIGVDDIELKGCKFITIWSLHYLYSKIADKKIFERNNIRLKVDKLRFISLNYTDSIGYL